MGVCNEKVSATRWKCELGEDDNAKAKKTKMIKRWLKWCIDPVNYI